MRSPLDDPPDDEVPDEVPELVPPELPELLAPLPPLALLGVCRPRLVEAGSDGESERRV